MSRYGKRCGCGHGWTAHQCVESRGSYWHGEPRYWGCRCGCHGVVRKTKKNGTHAYSICKCKEYVPKIGGASGVTR